MLMVSKGSKQENISNVQNLQKIYLYICIYFFYGTFSSHARLLITLTMPRTAHFMRVLRTKSEIAQTTSVDSSIAHTLWKKKKQN